VNGFGRGQVHGAEGESKDEGERLHFWGTPQGNSMLCERSALVESICGQGGVGPVILS
jgi:hypothetical protein